MEMEEGSGPVCGIRYHGAFYYGDDPVVSDLYEDSSDQYQSLPDSDLCGHIHFLFGISDRRLYEVIPDEILDAAVIDGCGTHGLLVKIVIPLIKNAIITNLVIQFFFKWNDLMAAMTFVSSKNLKTVQTGLLYFTDEFGTKNWGAIFASVSICVIPMLIMYLFLNKKVIEGMTAGATKG